MGPCSRNFPQPNLHAGLLNLPAIYAWGARPASLSGSTGPREG